MTAIERRHGNLRTRIVDGNVDVFDYLAEHEARLILALRDSHTELLAFTRDAHGVYEKLMRMGENSAQTIKDMADLAAVIARAEAIGEGE